MGNHYNNSSMAFNPAGSSGFLPSNVSQADQQSYGHYVPMNGGNQGGSQQSGYMMMPMPHNTTTNNSNSYLGNSTH